MNEKQKYLATILEENDQLRRKDENNKLEIAKLRKSLEIAIMSMTEVGHTLNETLNKVKT